MAFVCYIVDFHFLTVEVAFCHTFLIFRVVNQFFSHTHGAQCAYQYAENCCGNRYFKYVE